VDGRQTRIATARRVAALLLKVIEEGADDAWIEILQSKRGRLLPQALPREAEQEPKCVAVGCDRVGARLPLTDQTVREEGFEQGIEGYERTKSALHFGPDEPLTPSLVRKLLEARIAEGKRRQV
jgi:hypothetical protein